LTDEPASRRADGLANGDLALADAGSRQQQVRKIGARDQQDEAGRA